MEFTVATRASGRETSSAWRLYDGERIRLQQAKTGARVVVPVGAPLKAALDAVETRGERILLNSRGRPWDEDGFRSSFNKARKRAGVEGVTFNDCAEPPSHGSP
jgi:hypothetical protein